MNDVVKWTATRIAEAIGSRKVSCEEVIRVLYERWQQRGAAAILAAGGSALDVGSDTGGSIRVPSHFCGTAGIKPTAGLLPKTGHILPLGGLVDAMTQLGPMARKVEDLALALPILAGVDWNDPSVVPMPIGDYRNVSVEGCRVHFSTATESLNRPLRRLPRSLLRSSFLRRVVHRSKRLCRV